MQGINTYKQRLQEFVKTYSLESVCTAFSYDKCTPATWSDVIWYFIDPTLGTLHRYIFIAYVEGKKRNGNDRLYKREHFDLDKLLSVENEKLLKIYAIYVQGLSIVNNSKQYRVVVACKILTEADRLGGLEKVPMNFWKEIKQSNHFWDFARKHGLIPSGLRPSHQCRQRSADSVTERSSGVLKMTPDSLVHALGGIFNTVFAGVNDHGRLKQGASIDVPDAVSITAAVLGLAAPNRTNSEVPLLQNQLVKTVCPGSGDPVSYLDWPGSKGFSDNQNHILSVLAPEVSKAVAFLSDQFKPERHLLRFYKDTSSGWDSILKGFFVDKKRKARMDFSKKPNLFSVSYALGFYPVDYKVGVIKDPQSDVIIKDNEDRKRYQFNMPWNPGLKRRACVKDLIVEKYIYDINLDDCVINNTRFIKKNDSVYESYTVSKMLNIFGLNEPIRNQLRLNSNIVVIDLATLQKRIVRYQHRLLDNFPLDFCDGDKGIDIERALFCIAFSKHGFPNPKHTFGCNLIISPLKRVRTHIFSSFDSSERVTNPHDRNIFHKYGYGSQKLRFHSLRHFANTNAEKGGIPLSVIASWSGRASIKQTLEYVHTSEDDKAERLISTLDLDDDDLDVRVISSKALANDGGLPASTTGTGICVQELSVTPCTYINDFLSGCFGCESSCYVCGDLNAIELLEKDYEFQLVRLERMMGERGQYLSEARKKWWITHSIGVSLLVQLIEILRTGKFGGLVRISSDRRHIFVTDRDTKSVSRQVTKLPTETELLQELEQGEEAKGAEVPESMKSILASFGLENSG